MASLISGALPAKFLTVKRLRLEFVVESSHLEMPENDG
jgi:hypothetical protein